MVVCAGVRFAGRFMKIAIVGAGWYGCHLAAFLRQIGFDVALFERGAEVFTGASGKNQNRLHLGFHYARDHTTRFQSRDGFSRFIERYPNLSRPVTDNIYAVPQGDSLIDYRTYKAIMASSGIEFEELGEGHAAVAGLTRLAGRIDTDERIVDTGAAARFFRAYLDPVLRLGTRVRREDIREAADGVRIGGERFDYLIDATWGKLTRPEIDIFYEPTLLLYYETRRRDWAFTLVDGQLCSIYPTDVPGQVTLSSVPHTPLGHFTDIAAAEHALATLPAATIHEKRGLFEAQIRRYYPAFDESFTYVGPQLSMKTKPVGAEDNRACYVFRQGRVFCVMSGKIDTIFVAAERIISSIGQPDFGSGFGPGFGSVPTLLTGTPARVSAR